MSYIVFFSIPAHGHTNPTIPVVQELVQRGHQIRYYSFKPYQRKIEAAGAEFVDCEKFLPPMISHADKRIGKDFSALVEMTANTTLNMETTILPELEANRPDCIVADSMCTWGKLFAQRLQLPWICSTTSFAFNQATSRLMKQDLKEVLYLLKGLPRIRKKIRQLQNAGYDVPHLFSLIQNDNDTPTIVFTSREFQPLAETFSDLYTFAGPSLSVPDVPSEKESSGQKQLYISLGTVNNKNRAFYRNCIQAFQGDALHVIMSVGEETDILALGEIPDNIQIFPQVAQLEVLQSCDVFLTHCGMNSVQESLYFSVPMVLYPQQSEQELVAVRTAELGAGLRLSGNQPEQIRDAVYQVLENPAFRRQAVVLSESLHRAGGAKSAADAVEKRLFLRNSDGV